MPVSEHEKKMVNLRLQVQQNQTELHDYLADLESWEKDIKNKEGQLKAGKTEKSQDLPPVRNTIQKKKMKKKRKEKTTDEASKPKKISGYDFRAWDKFDVDKALEDIDKEVVETSSSEYETDEEWEIERKKHLAGLEKDKGNEFLKNNEYDKAVEAYTKGMELDATNAVIPANRAMALLKQQKFAAAELDCTVSISLDPMYVKAYLRRATARAGMRKFNEAITDFNRVLDLEPSNKQAKSEIERLQKELMREKECPVLSTLTEEGKGIVKPIYKQPEERSKAPLRRIIIEEIGLETRGQQHPVKLGHSDTAKNIVSKEEKNFDELFTSQTALLDQTPSSNTSNNELPLVPESSRLESRNPQSENSRDQQQELSTRLSIDSREEHEDFSKSIPSNVLKAQKRPSWNAASNKESNLSFSPESGHNQRNFVPGTRNEANNNNVSNKEFTIPQSSFQFQNDFRLLKNKLDSFFQYFQVIPPAHYPKLFGQCLDADMLMVILKSLAANLDKCKLDVYDVLYQLTQVKRFSMTVMFLSQQDKQVARGLMEQLSKSGVRPQNDILSLISKYEL